MNVSHGMVAYILPWPPKGDGNQALPPAPDSIRSARLTRSKHTWEKPQAVIPEKGYNPDAIPAYGDHVGSSLKVPRGSDSIRRVHVKKGSGRESTEPPAKAVK
ncbi:MAG: hypothetical protein RLZZ165_2202 [Bacteroidota bacterium]|jgi:hypothetical protein